MKSTSAILACLLLVLASGMVNASDVSEQPVSAQHHVLKASGHVEGTLGVIQAYQAILERNATALSNALKATPNPANENLKFDINGSVLTLRLIHVAVLMKDPVTISLLLKSGARIGAKDSLGRTALHYACFGAPELGVLFNFVPQTDSEIASSILELLRSEAIDLEATDKNLRTALHYAALVGDKDTLSRLLEFGVSKDPVDAFGFTPRQLAIRSGHFVTAQLLAAAGATFSATPSDVLIGIKNRVASFSLAHPFVCVGTALGSIAAIATRLIVPTANAEPVSQVDLDRDPTGNTNDNLRTRRPPPDLGIRKAYGYINGGSIGGGTFVPPVERTKQKSPNVEQIAALKPKGAVPVAVVEAPKVLSTWEKLERATKRLNGERNSTPASLMAALQVSETLLDEVESQRLSDHERDHRRFLVASINCVAKLKDSAKGPQISEAKRLLETYGKYREERPKRRR